MPAFMDERRDILISLGRRILLAVPLLVTTWLLFSSTNADAGRQFLGLACAAAAGIILAPPFAALIALPAGSLFFPRRPARPEPGYSVAEARRKRGEYEASIDEYQRIAEQFPAEVHPHVAMMEIAFVDLHDGERTDAIAKQALAMLRDDGSRQRLLRMHRAIKARVPDDPWMPEESEEEAAHSESDSEKKT